jgi:hypothetical protein
VIYRKNLGRTFMLAREFVNMRTAHTNTNVLFPGSVVLGYNLLSCCGICGGLRFFRTRISTRGKMCTLTVKEYEMPSFVKLVFCPAYVAVHGLSNG